MTSKIFLNETKEPCFDIIHCNAVIEPEDFENLLNTLQELFVEQPENPDVVYPKTVLSSEKLRYYGKRHDSRQYYISSFCDKVVTVVVINGLLGVEIDIDDTVPEYQRFLEIYRCICERLKMNNLKPISLDWLTQKV